MTLEEHIAKISGTKDIQIAALLAQIDFLKEQAAKTAAPKPEAPVGDIWTGKPNGRTEPPAPPV